MTYINNITIFIKFPVFIAIGPEPLSFGIMIFVFEAHRNAVASKRPQFFDQTVIKFLRPLAPQELLDLLAGMRSEMVLKDGEDPTPARIAEIKDKAKELADLALQRK